MSDFDPADYTLMGNDQVIIDLINGMLMARYTVCYWDNADGRREYIKDHFKKFGDLLRCEEMKLKASGMPHYDISIFVNPTPNAYMKEFRVVAALANLEMFT
jgi:hypothetical protein